MHEASVHEERRENIHVKRLEIRTNRMERVHRLRETPAGTVSFEKRFQNTCFEIRLKHIPLPLRRRETR